MKKTPAINVSFEFFHGFPCEIESISQGTGGLSGVGVPASFLACQVGGETQAEEAVVVTTQAGGEATDHEEETRGREGASLPQTELDCSAVKLGVKWGSVCSCQDYLHSVQFSSVAQSCLPLCDPMNCSSPGLPVLHQLPEFTQTHIHRVGDAIEPSHPLSSPSPPAPNPSQHQSLFQ